MWKKEGVRGKNGQCLAHKVKKMNSSSRGKGRAKGENLEAKGRKLSLGEPLEKNPAAAAHCTLTWRCRCRQPS